MALDYLDKMIALGMGRSVTVGALSTGVTGGGAGTVMLIDEPELVMAVPSGVVVRPIYCSISVEGGTPTADGNKTESLLAVDSISFWSGDGTFTDEQPSNMNTRFGPGSSCRIGSAVTGALTTRNQVGTDANPVLDMELARYIETQIVGSTPVDYGRGDVNLVYAPALPEWLEGPCTLLAYFGGDIAATGYILLRWVEAPVSVMKQFAGV